MPDEMYVVCLENDCLKDITRTLLRCRLLNKMKGMKPTRELHIRRRPRTGARKSLAGPTPEKDNEASPAQDHYTILFVTWVVGWDAVSVPIFTSCSYFHLHCPRICLLQD